jgi:hypothetical protein
MFNWSRLISNEDLTGKPETLSDNNTQNQPQIINPEGPMSTFSIDDIDSPKTVSPQPQEQSEEDITVCKSNKPHFQNKKSTHRELNTASTFQQEFKTTNFHVD